MSNPITVAVALEVASHEAIIRRAYKDSVGVWTWSVGLTSATGHNVERYIGKPQTLEHCLAIYLWALNNYADDVRSKFKAVKLTEPQFAAAVSFHWNTGAIRQATWVNEFLAGETAKAKLSIMNWKTPPEIEERRERERDLFFDGVWHNTGKMTEYTRLTSASRPDWKSAKLIDVRAQIEKILNPAGTPIVVDPVVTPELPGVIATPDWTAAQHIANIQASANALAELAKG